MRARHDEHEPAGREVVVLSDAEFERRCLLLAALRVPLRAAGARCEIARHQRLVLTSRAGRGVSGRTDPALHIFLPDGRSGKARTDGEVFRLDRGGEFPASDLAAAAEAIGVSLAREGG